MYITWCRSSDDFIERDLSRKRSVVKRNQKELPRDANECPWPWSTNGPMMSRHRVILISKALLLTRNPIELLVARRRMKTLRGNADFRHPIQISRQINYPTHSSLYLTRERELSAIRWLYDLNFEQINPFSK